MLHCSLLDDLEIDLRLARFENLMDQRPILLNSVLLRQNPHNVNEWQKRVKLFEGKPREVSLSHMIFNQSLILPVKFVLSNLMGLHTLSALKSNRSRDDG